MISQPKWFMMMRTARARVGCFRWTDELQVLQPFLVLVQLCYPLGNTSHCNHPNKMFMMVRIVRVGSWMFLKDR